MQVVINTSMNMCSGEAALTKKRDRGPWIKDGVLGLGTKEIFAQHLRRVEVVGAIYLIFYANFCVQHERSRGGTSERPFIALRVFLVDVRRDLKMWHEARKQEKKLRGMMVDYRKRAERRRAFYERMVGFHFHFYIFIIDQGF